MLRYRQLTGQFIEAAGTNGDSVGHSKTYGAAIAGSPDVTLGTDV